MVYLLGESLFLNGDFKKVHSLFLKHRLLTHNIDFQVLAAKALLANRQHEQCLAVLDMQLDQPYLSKKLEAVRLCLKGRCNEAMENKAGAVGFYSECLKRDPTCI
jgi:hypothetical protein